MSHPTPRRLRPQSVLAAMLSATLLAGAIAAVETVTAPPARATGSFGALATQDKPSDIVMANGFAYVANQNSNSVSVFESATWNPVSTIAVGAAPGYIAANHAGTEVWVSNATDASITIIDTSTNTVDATLAVSGLPKTTLFTADDATAYVLNFSFDTVQVVDTATRTFTTVGSSLGLPNQGVLSADEQFLYYDGGAGMDRIYKLDLTTGEVLSDLTLPFANINEGAEFVTSNPAGTELWALLATDVANGRVQVYNDSATVEIASVPLSSEGGEISFSPSGDIAYVTEYANDTVAVIDTQTFEVITRVTVGNEPIALATAPSGLVAVLNNIGDTMEIIGLTKERLAGDNRYSTAVEISKKSFPIGFPGGVGTVFIASGETFPDALAAGPAAGLVDGPLLLTARDALPAVVATELARLNPSTVYIVGGTGAVSNAVMDAVTVIEPNTIRISGQTRYATANAIVDEVWTGTVSEVYIATGRAYPDALSAGAVAASTGKPVILVDGASGSVPSDTLALISSLAPSTITIAGGTGTVSQAIMDQLTTQFSSSTVRRLAGASRYETSAAISADAYPTSETVLFATGANFPDALAAATLAARADAPLYLTLQNCVSPGALAGLYDGHAPYLFLLGGTGVLSPAVEALTPCS